MTAPAPDHQQQGATIWVAFAQHRSKASGSFRAAQDATDLDMRRQSVSGHALQFSGRVALVRAQQNCGQRIATARSAHFFKRSGIARHTTDCRQGLQVLRTRVDG